MGVRGTQYRGISRNCNKQWQILVQCNSQRYYVGSVDNIDKAAILHDLIVLQSKGLKAKTNFSYMKHELLAILVLGDLKSSKVKL